MKEKGAVNATIVLSGIAIAALVASGVLAWNGVWPIAIGILTCVFVVAFILGIPLKDVMPNKKVVADIVQKITELTNKHNPDKDKEKK